ncbi:MAG: hypothetical protein ACWGQW_01025, partial [bacterium]
IVFDERNLATKKMRRGSPELVKYEHFLARYGLPTAPLFMKKPGRYGNQVIRAFEYLSFQRQGEWLKAIWDYRRQNGLI